MRSAIWQQVKDFAFITWLKTKSEDSFAYMLLRRNDIRTLICKPRFVVKCCPRGRNDEGDENDFKYLCQALKEILSLKHIKYFYTEIFVMC